MAEVHPSHYLEVADEISRMRREIGQLKTAKSTLESELGALQRRNYEDALLDATAAYLKEQGAEVVGIRGIKMIHEPGAQQYNWQLVINFTGVPPQTNGDT